MRLDLLCFGVREDVRLEICRLGEFLVATIEGTNVWSISSVNANMCSVNKKKLLKSTEKEINSLRNSTVD